MNAKSYLLLLLLVTTCQYLVSAQNNRKFLQPAHVFPQSLSWWDSIYFYPDFRPGQITYFTDFTPQQHLLMNYNLYYGQMEIITAAHQVPLLEHARETLTWLDKCQGKVQ